MLGRDRAQAWLVTLGIACAATACAQSDFETAQPTATGDHITTDEVTVEAKCAASRNGTVEAGVGGAGAVLLTPVRAATSADDPPPPISGGTLLTTRDGRQLVAADPDRDQVYFIDIASETLSFVTKLQKGDEPGRLVEDAAGRIHVALRSGGAVATLGREADMPVTRRAVCDLPRGLAYDAAQDALQVGCAEGQLVTLAAAPSGAVTRRVELGGDLRDVIVRGSQLFVSRFRSAELLSIGQSGNVVARRKPPSFGDGEAVFDDATCSISQKLVVRSTPTVAWRALDVPGQGVAMLHQRAREAEVQTSPGGYGGGSSCAPGIVHTALTMGVDSPLQRTADLGSLALAVDFAVDPAGQVIAVVAPGNAGSGQAQLEFHSVEDSQNWSVDSQPDVRDGSAANASACAAPISQPTSPRGALLENDVMQAQDTAVTFSTPDVVAVLEREPAGIRFVDVRTGDVRSHLDLEQPTRYDSGHALFHTRAGAGLACASCHPEGGEDSHVWSFHGIGARRTQQLRGGILGTEPFHWNGDMQDFPTLVQEVFVGRMQGVDPGAAMTSALAHWIDRLPELKVTASDAVAAARGKELFESAAVGCNGCHSGPHLTNNATVSVGTGVLLQVPSLRNVAMRTPLMHDGCALTLMDRFSDLLCGGGDQHGHTSQLSAAQLGDLAAYLQTL